MAENPIIGFRVDPADIQYIGQDLQRPECILAEPDGTLWSADARRVRHPSDLSVAIKV